MASAGGLLLQSRRKAGLTQTELAVRAGISPSVVSDYERGRRQPTLPTLERLIQASGHALVVEVAPAPRTRRLREIVTEHREQVLTLVREHGVSNLRLFGSAARGDDGPDSDIDLLVSVPPGVGLFPLFRLTAALEDLLGARVDLVPDQGLKAGLQAEILAEAVAV